MFSVFVLGISSIIFQLSFFREIYSLITENEIIFSILLFNWLILNSIGSFIGGIFKTTINTIKYLHIICAFIPYITLFSIRLLNDQIFIRGTDPDILPFFIFSFVLLSPFCILNGIFLPVAYSVFNKKNNISVYNADNIGDFLGGLLFTFFFAYINNTFITYFFICIINFFALFRLRFNKKIFFLLVVFAFIPFIINADKKTLSYVFKGLDIKEIINSKYGRIAVIKEKKSYLIFENSRPAMFEGSLKKAEEAANILMLQNNNIKDVLIVSLYSKEFFQKLKEFGVEKIDYLELNEKLTQTAQKYDLLKEMPGLNIINKDPRKFIENTNNTYSGIILSVPLPNELKHNRYYTNEFFKSLLAIMKKKGYAELILPGFENYLGKEEKHVFSAIKSTIKKTFSNVCFFPGKSTVLLFSNNDIKEDLVKPLKESKISNVYFNKPYINSNYSIFRTKIFENLNSDIINHDKKPVLFSFFQDYLFQKKGLKQKNLYFSLLIILTIIIGLLNRKKFSVFSTSFSASSVEIIIFYFFEIFFGTLYYGISFLVSAYLCGLFLGYLVGEKYNIKSAFKCDLLCLLSLFLLLLLHIFEFCFVLVLILFIVAFFSAYQFAILFKNSQKSLSQLYTADFLGSALGIIITGLILFPIFGFLKTTVFLIGLKLISLMIEYKYGQT